MPLTALATINIVSIHSHRKQRPKLELIIKSSVLLPAQVMHTTLFCMHIIMVHSTYFMQYSIKSQPSLVSTFYEDFSSSERVERAIFLQRTDEKESEDFFTSDGLHKIAQCNPCRLCELLGSYFTQGSVSSLIKRSIRQYDGRLNH